MTEKEKAMLRATYNSLFIKRFKALQEDDTKPYVSLKALPTPAIDYPTRPYSSFDGILLMLNSEVQGYKTNIYSTKEQWEYWFKGQCEFKVKKKQRPFPLIDNKVMYKNNFNGNLITTKEYDQLTNFEAVHYEVYVEKTISKVYNLDQLELIGDEDEKIYRQTALRLTKSTNPFDGKEKLDTLLEKAAWFCKITKVDDEDSACYDIRQDEIILTTKIDWEKHPEVFYEDLLHTMAHSTGNESHEKRFLEEKGWGVEDNFYYKEELIAELSAMYVAARCGMEKYVVFSDSSLIDIWIRTLEKEKDYIWTLLNRTTSAILWMMEGILEANNHKQFECLSL